MPTGLSALTALQSLHLGGTNTWNGTLPAAWSALTALQELTLSNTSNGQISGSIPGSWSSLNLQVFTIANNLLSGTIPSFIGDWTGLTALDIANNEFAGTVPASFTGLVQPSLTVSVAGNNLDRDAIHDALLTTPIETRTTTITSFDGSDQ